MRSRRLVGPTILSLVLCGLLADHLFLGESPWSVARFLGKFLGAFATVLAPPPSPAFYNWLGRFWLPIFLVIAVVALLGAIFAGAKRAMSKASGEIKGDAQVALHRPAAAAPMHLITASEEARRPVGIQGGLFARLVFTISAIAAVFGIVACVTVHGFLSATIERQAKERAGIMISGLRDVVAAAPPIGRNGAVAAVVENYVSRNPVVYVYVEDAAGQVASHWPRDLLRYLSRDFPRSSQRALVGVDGEYRGESVYAVAARTGDGNSGFVHLAIDRSVVAAETRRVVMTIAAVFFLILLLVVGILLYIVRSLQKPWSELVDHADRISRADFAVPLALQRSDEFGDIARSLERMRSSLRAVTARLEPGQAMRRSNE